ncbi:MAG: hypothetical protein O7F73_11665 [Gammaproteobacteria bacterium]|nr:hypothetical protein [Gammaproteobacteria bacterium]
MKFIKALLIGTCLFALTQATQAQRQLQCEPDQQCTITCYQDGMDNAEKIFHREQIDTLQVDLNARVLKIEFRERPDQSTAYDYFILGSKMSCTIKNMRGMHD